MLISRVIWRRDFRVSFRDWDFANCLNRKPRFPKFLISSARKREKVTRPAATRPLGSKDNTKGRSHSQQNDDFGVPRTRLPHATRPPETDSRTLAFSAVLRARKEKKKENIERNDAFKPYGPQKSGFFVDHCQGIGWVMGYLLISRYDKGI